jgi:transposase
MVERKQRRQYTPEFEAEAVKLADSVGVSQAAKRLGVPSATMSNWATRRRKVALPGAGSPAPGSPTSGAPRRPVGDLEAENARLRRELANAKLDNEILRKAAAYLARESR